MTRVIPFTGNEHRPRLTPEQRERNEQVATGVGGVAGLSASATKMAGKRGMRAKSGEQVLQQMMNTVETTTRTVNQNTKVAKGLWGTFKHNITMYTDDILRRLNSLKNHKFIAKIIDSPITKKAAGFFGGALAFFVLVTGINKAFKTGSIAVDDFKKQIREFNA